MTNVQRNLFIFTHVYFIIVVFQKTIIVGIVTLNSMEFIYVAILFLFLFFYFYNILGMSLMLIISIAIL